MTTLEPLPVRTCSGCKSWGKAGYYLGDVPYVEDKATGTMQTICQVHNALRRGGESCGAWEKPEEKLPIFSGSFATAYGTISAKRNRS